MDTTLMSEYVELHKKIIEKLYRYVEYHYCPVKAGKSVFEIVET